MVFRKYAANLKGEHPYQSVIFAAYFHCRNSLHIFRTPFPNNTPGGLLLKGAFKLSSLILYLRDKG